MTRLAIHFSNKAHTTVDNVAAFWQSEKYLHVRTSFGNCPEERQYARKKIIAIFEVEDDGKRRIL